MDGNFNLVHRSAAGKSVRKPLHSGRFFLPQELVDEFVNLHNKKPDETQVLHVDYFAICIIAQLVSTVSISMFNRTKKKVQY